MRSGRIRTRVRIGLVLAVAVAIAGYGVATTVAFHTSGAFLAACVRSDQGQGNLRVVAPGTACRANEESVLLAKFPPSSGVGPTHLETITIDNEIFNAQSTRTYSWDCEAGTLVSAGATTTELDRLVISESLPTTDGWRVTFKNTTDTEVGADAVTLSALCSGAAP